MKVRVLLGFMCVSVSLAADTSAPAADAIVDHYIAAIKAQEVSLPGASMEVEIKGFLPKLKKYGNLHALRKISPLGLIKYERIFFEGDRTVNKEVIQRYMNAEIESQKEHRADIAVTPQNYRFKYKGLNQSDGREVYVFQVTPKQKRESLFKGEIWIDTQTYLKVQESGYLVKNPSFLIKKVAFIRKYEIRDGVSAPKQVLSVVDTRLVGKAELTIEFTKFELDSSRRLNAEAGDQ